MTKPTLVVLAAGMGSRYGGLKQIDPVGPNDEIIVDYSIYDALKAGFGKVVFVIKQNIERIFRKRVGKAIERQCETAYVLQMLDDVPPGIQIPPGREKPWGTGHATLSCKDVVDSPFAVINADDFYGRSAFQLLATYLGDTEGKERDDVYNYCMVGYVLENTLTEHGHVARGVCTVDSDGYLVSIHERTRIERFGDTARYTEDGEHWITIPRDTVVSMNAWGFTPGLFSELEGRFSKFLKENQGTLVEAEYFLPEVVGALVQEGRARVKMLPTEARWFGVTYHEDKARVKQAIEDLIDQGVYPDNLWG